MSTNFFLHRPDGEPVHIGKISQGWVFLWHGYREPESPAPLELDGPEAWFAWLYEALGQRECEIRDETGLQLPLHTFNDVVKVSRTGRNRVLISPEDTTYTRAGGDDVVFADFR